MKLFKNLYYIPIIAILVLLTIGRINLYGDLHLSMPMRDTDTFVSSSEAPIFSWESMTGRRLFTTNLLYKIFTPSNGYPSVDASVDTSWRKIYSGFGNIAFFQSILSILGWGFLSLALSSKLKNPLIKILSTVIILLFGFSPQVADWDSVLSAEALSFSLFVFSLGFLILLVFDNIEQKQVSIKTALLATFWLIGNILWSFIRDTNLYAIFTTLIMIIATWVIYRPIRRSKILMLLGITLVIFFVLGLASSMDSNRSNIQVEHALFEFVLPYPSRAEFMTNLGMPSPETPEFSAWFDKYAPRSYMIFLISHPGFTLTKYLNDTYIAFNPYMQSYFRAPHLHWRMQLIKIGEFLHPNITSLIISLVLFFALSIYAINNKDSNKDSGAWTWVTTWIFLAGASTLFVSIFGDTVALHRHAIISTTFLRLLMWILVLVLSDLLITKNPVLPKEY